MSDRPPHYAPETARAYVASITSRVGDRDPVALMGAAPAALAAAVEGLDEAEVRRAPEPCGWSVLQILRHLADCEMVYGVRMRLVVAEDRPALAGFDQEAWAERLHYDRGTLAADLEAQRAVTLRWLRTLSDAELDRVGVHTERGEESVRQITVLLAGHDLAHLAQIERGRAALRP